MKDKPVVKVINQGPGGVMLLIAYIGAAVYFVQQSSGFWPVIGALFKAMVWPAFVLYHVLRVLHV